jgi:hypothetical protein
MQIEITEMRKGYISDFGISTNKNLVAKYKAPEINSAYSKKRIKIYNKSTGDFYEVKEDGFLSFKYVNLYLNNKLENRFIENKTYNILEFANWFAEGTTYNILENKYNIYLHNNPEHGIPDIFSITNYSDEQVALVSRDVKSLGYEYKSKNSLFGTEKILVTYNTKYDSDLISELDLFILVVYEAVFSYGYRNNNTFSPISGGLSVSTSYGINTVYEKILNESHKEHLLWTPKDEI